MAAPSRSDEAPRRVIDGVPLGSPVVVMDRPATLPCSIEAGSVKTPWLRSLAWTVVMLEVTSLRRMVP